MSIHGVDISSYQGTVKFQSIVSSGYSFVICKASEGTSITDPYFSQNWSGIKSYGMQRACYHVCHPELNTYQAEINYFISVMNSVGGVQQGDVIALDVEFGTTNVLQWVLGWLQGVSAVLGFNPMLYTSMNYIQNYGLNDPSLGIYGLWLADYMATEPPSPSPWNFIACWQSGQGTVSGASSPVDLDTFYGTVQQFALYGKPQEIPSPTIKPKMTDTDRYQLIKYICGGSGVTDLLNWVNQFTD